MPVSSPREDAFGNPDLPGTSERHFFHKRNRLKIRNPERMLPLAREMRLNEPPGRPVCPGDPYNQEEETS